MMTISCHKDNITIFGNDGRQSWQGKRKTLTIKGLGESNLVSESIYHGVKDIVITEDGVTASFEESDDMDIGEALGVGDDYLEYLGRDE